MKDPNAPHNVYSPVRTRLSGHAGAPPPITDLNEPVNFARGAPLPDWAQEDRDRKTKTQAAMQAALREQIAERDRARAEEAALIQAEQEKEASRIQQEQEKLAERYRREKEAEDKAAKEAEEAKRKEVPIVVPASTNTSNVGSVTTLNEDVLRTKAEEAALRRKNKLRKNLGPPASAEVRLARYFCDKWSDHFAYDDLRLLNLLFTLHFNFFTAY
jgi:flagellar biosynthesis GTPase FlhF